MDDNGDDLGPELGEGPRKVMSVSLPEGTVRALREAAGDRGVSAFVAAAVEEQLRRQAALRYLAEYEREHGAFTADELRQADEILNAAHEEDRQCRKAS
jgi:hypothetical protein